jgi:3-oxoacyl-[acyl-carrier-protein] synthase II
MINAMRAALRESRLTPQQVGHLHAHGLGTRTGDAEEASAIRTVFGERADTLPVTAAKSYFGNLGAGSGVIELIASALALKNKQLFGVLNYQTSDPDCQLNVVRSSVDPGDTFLNLSVTPQAQASCVIVQRLGSVS